MTAVRRDIVRDIDARKHFTDGVHLLKAERLGISTTELGIAGPEADVTTYDLFVVWHHVAMNRFTPPSQSDRNAAHRGPVFLPWHRFMLLLFEMQLQRVLDDEDFGLPYWNWAADGDLQPSRQMSAPIWDDDAMGGDGSPIRTGPYAFRPRDPGTWRVNIEVDVTGSLRTTSRGMRRAFGANIDRLPTSGDVEATIALDRYDASPWSTTSAGFRNRVEGWRPLSGAPGMHNRVHVWVGGDMLPSSSPNDPIFYLNHCNVDRLWSRWQQEHSTAPYLPDNSASAGLRGHRVDDAMYALLSRSLTPRQVLDLSSLYTYDRLT